MKKSSLTFEQEMMECLDKYAKEIAIVDILNGIDITIEAQELPTKKYETIQATQPDIMKLVEDPKETKWQSLKRNINSKVMTIVRSLKR